jgi:5'-nucleotidase / UDP-sugar diphosphatase
MPKRTFAVMVLCALLGLWLQRSTLQAQPPAPFRLTLLHTNDTHSQHTPQFGGLRAGDGGAAIQASVTAQVRAEQPNTLLLDAGDRFGSSLFHYAHRGMDNAQVMNLLGYQAMTLGVSDWADGIEPLEAFVSALDFAVVAANLDLSALPALDAEVEPFTIMQVDGEAIGIIGLVHPRLVELARLSAPVRVNEDSAAAVNGAITLLKAQGVNKIVLLSHQGMANDFALIPQLRDIDVVVGAYDHALFSNTILQRSVSNIGAERARLLTAPLILRDVDGRQVVYMQAGERNMYLGRLDLNFNAEGQITAIIAEPILLSRYITPDPAMTELLTNLAQPFNDLRAAPLGFQVGLGLEGLPNICRIEECTLGNLAADAMRQATNAQIALLPSSALANNIFPMANSLNGVLTGITLTPQFISSFEVTGADVRAALEFSLNTLPLQDGQVNRLAVPLRFFQVSGARYRFDPNLEIGQRLTALEVLNEDGAYVALDDAATYRVVTVDSVVRGELGHVMLRDNGRNVNANEAVLLDVLLAHMRRIGGVGVIREGRIVIENATVTPLP